MGVFFLTATNLKIHQPCSLNFALDPILSQFNSIGAIFL